MNERPNTNSAQHSIRRHLAIGVTTVVLLVGGVGAWAVTTELSGAVIAAGQLVVEASVKKVQRSPLVTPGKRRSGYQSTQQVSENTWRLIATQAKSCER